MFFRQNKFEADLETGKAEAESGGMLSENFLKFTCCKSCNGYFSAF